MNQFFSTRIVVVLLILGVGMGHAQRSLAGVFHLHSFQMPASLRGIITDANGQPVDGATILLKGPAELGTSSNEQGFYEIKHLPAGNYVLSITFVGMVAESRQVDLSDNQLLNLNFTLKDKQEQLNEVVFEDKAEHKAFSKAETEYVAKMPLKNLENPQVYTTVSQKLMKEQVATDLDAALKNVPGAGVPVRLNQNRITFLSRGFSTQPKIRNGLTSFIQTFIDPVNLERIEVLKGPSATLFGSSVVSYGGLLNRVTKRPYDQFGGVVNYSAGSWNLNRLTLDINTPVNASKTLLFRMNGAVHNEKSFQDAGFSNDVAITPTLTYQITAKTKLFVDVEYTKSKGTSPVRFTPYTSDGMETLNVKDMHLSYKRSFASNDIYYTGESLNIFVQMDHQLSKNWISRTAVSRTKSVFDGYTSQETGRSATTFRTKVTVGEYGYYSTDLQQNFIGDFKIGTLRNRLVVGLDYYDYYADRDIVNVNTGTYDFTDPASAYYDTYNKAYIDSASVGAARTAVNQETQTYSAYASDVINVTDRLLAMLSLRLDYFDDHGSYDITTHTSSDAYTQAALSPKLGLVYQIVKEKVSVFGNYMNGFSNQTGSDQNGNTFKPEHANQIEGGLKADLFEHRLSGSVSYYDIRVEDILRTDPSDANYSIQDGSQLSKGVEVELTAEPVKNLNILAGYAYNDSKYTQADESVDGLRPTDSGPATLINWWASYEVPFQDSRALKFGFGGNYGSSSYQTNTTTAKVVIPSYTTLDASVSYKVKNMGIAFKLNNITNEQYWSYRLAPQKPRNFVVSANFNF